MNEHAAVILILVALSLVTYVLQQLDRGRFFDTPFPLACTACLVCITIVIAVPSAHPDLLLPGRAIHPFLTFVTALYAAVPFGMIVAFRLRPSRGER